MGIDMRDSAGNDNLSAHAAVVQGSIHVMRAAARGAAGHLIIGGTWPEGHAKKKPVEIGLRSNRIARAANQCWKHWPAAAFGGNPAEAGCKIVPPIDGCTGKSRGVSIAFAQEA